MEKISQDGRFGIFTTAEIIPILHSYRTERLEVFDKCSDLILIDFEQGTVTDNPGISGTEYQETFPCFSADNHTIYFCRAPYIPQPDSTRHMRYDLYSISFNPQTGQLGDSIHEVFRASSEGKSVSFPKAHRTANTCCSPYPIMVLSPSCIQKRTFGCMSFLPERLIKWKKQTDGTLIPIIPGAVIPNG